MNKGLATGLLLTGLLTTGCATNKQLEQLRIEMKQLHSFQHSEISTNKGSIQGLERRVDNIDEQKVNKKEFANSIKSIGDYRDKESQKTEKNLRELGFRIETIEYSLERDRTAILSGESTGYRSVLKAAEKTSEEMSLYVKGLRSDDYTLFVRDFQNVEGDYSVLGSRTTEEFTTLLKKRLGDSRKVYNEGTVIGLYKEKNLKVPHAEAFNLNNLERGGFKSEHVLVISGKLDSTPRSIRLSLGAIDLKDPQFKQSSFGTIIRDEGISQAYQKKVKK